jgi:outer membrane protein TolC
MTTRFALVALLFAPGLVAAQSLRPTTPVEDEMLAPLAPAPREISSWPEARRTLTSRSTDLRRAEAGLARAGALRRQAMSALFPDADLSLGLSYDLLGDGPAAGVTSAQPTRPLATVSVRATQAVIDVAAWRARDVAAAGQRGAAATVADTRRRVDQELAGTLVAVVSAERVAVLNRDGLRLALERQALLSRTFQLGAATELDVVRGQQDVAVARSAVIAGDERTRATREALGQALGLDGEVGVSSGFVLEGLTQELAASCRPLGDTEARADLVAARAQVEAARLRRAQVKAGYLPRLGLSTELFGRTESPGFASFTSWTISAVLTVPIWEGGLRRGLLEEQSASVRDAEAVADELGRTVSLEVARARRGVEVARALLTSATEARALAARVDEMTRRSFTIGRATSVDLVQSATILRLAELTLAQREFEWFQARIAALLTEAQCGS